jgi:hypothetical protein
MGVSGRLASGYLFVDRLPCGGQLIRNHKGTNDQQRKE